MIQENIKPGDRPAQNPLHLSVAPFCHHSESIAGIMRMVCIALIPALCASTIFFGVRVLVVVIISIASCYATEIAVLRLRRRPIFPLDLSALVTGLLFAFTLPPTVPLWMVPLGSFFAIAIVKQAFGGLGNNFMNPALAARAFLQISYPKAFTLFVAPRFGFIDGFDGVSGATPLSCLRTLMAKGDFDAFGIGIQDALPRLFIGNVGGCIGETSALALLAGAFLLWYKRIIGFSLPVCFIASSFLLFWIFNGTGSFSTSEALAIPFFHILSGGFMLGALFMATDPVTTPMTARGRMLFGLGCGLLTFLFRRFSLNVDGVAYAILLMNTTTPLIDRCMQPRIKTLRIEG